MSTQILQNFLQTLTHPSLFLYNLTSLLSKTMSLDSPLDGKKIQLVHPKGDQSWVFIGRTDVEAETPIPWPPYAKI